MRRSAVFIDRDGVIFYAVPREGFVLPTASFCLEEAQLFDGLEEAFALLKNAGFLRILVTNQPDVVYGHLTQSEWEKIHAKISHLDFDDQFICFHGWNDECECKKPKPGMLFSAQKKWNIDFAASYMVGDTDNDAKAACAAGCRFVLVSALYNVGVPADFHVSSLLEAARLIYHLEPRRAE